MPRSSAAGQTSARRCERRGCSRLRCLSMPRRFDRFTSRALQVLFYARSQVSQLGSSELEPEHILLGLLDDDKGLGSRILARPGDPLDALRGDIVRRLPKRETISESDDIPFSTSCERVLQYAAEEADPLLHQADCTQQPLLRLPRQETR